MRAKWPSGGFKLTGWEQGEGKFMMDDKKTYNFLTSIVTQPRRIAAISLV